MPASADLGINSGDLVGPGGGSRRLPDRLGERYQIINAVRSRVELTVMADQIPPARSGKPARVLLAEVIGMGLGEGGERPYDSGRFRVNISQRRDRQSRAAVARTTPWGPHRRTVSPPETKR